MPTQSSSSLYFHLELTIAGYRAEKTTTVMESQLTILERKIDELLASVDLPNELEPIPPEERLENFSEPGVDADPKT